MADYSRYLLSSDALEKKGTSTLRLLKAEIGEVVQDIKREIQEIREDTKKKLEKSETKYIEEKIQLTSKHEDALRDGKEEKNKEIEHLRKQETTETQETIRLEGVTRDMHVTNMKEQRQKQEKKDQADSILNKISSTVRNDVADMAPKEEVVTMTKTFYTKKQIYDTIAGAKIIGNEKIKAMGMVLKEKYSGDKLTIANIREMIQSMDGISDEEKEKIIKLFQ
jgi:hypothetical protein